MMVQSHFLKVFDSCVIRSFLINHLINEDLVFWINKEKINEIKTIKKNHIWFGQLKVHANLAVHLASIKWNAASGLLGL